MSVLDDAREKLFSLILARSHRYIMVTTRNSIKAKGARLKLLRLFVIVIVSGKVRFWEWRVMKTLETSNSIIANYSPSSYFSSSSSSSLKERLLSRGPEFISYRRPWKLANSGLQHFVPLRRGGIDFISCFSSYQQVVGIGNYSFFAILLLWFHMFFFFLKNLGLLRIIFFTAFNYL